MRYCTALFSLCLALKVSGLTKDSPGLVDVTSGKDHFGIHPKLEDNQVEFYYEIHQGFETKSGKYLNFSNIPYAEPPIGELRWTVPEPPYAHEPFGQVNNGSKRAICPQFQAGWVPEAMDFVHDMFLDPKLDKKWKDFIGPGNYEPMPELHQDSSEDCLLLDVMVPKKVWEQRNSQFPVKAAVLVWIHGGGFIFGSKDQTGSPEHLLDAALQEDNFNSMIFVSINYRLGAFGWLGGKKAYDDYVEPNLGLKDQELALKWVREYIDQFGGDRSRITVMGESAGASSIMHHIAAHGSYDRPTFQAAIVQSPAFFPSPNQTTQDQTYQQFLALAGAKNVEELAKLDTKVLMQANANITYYSRYGLFTFGPTVLHGDIKNLPGMQLNEINGGLTNIPMMIGHTKYDGLLFTPPWVRNDAQLREHIRTMYPGVSDALLDEVEKRYPIADVATAKEKLLQVSDFLDDVAIQCNTYYLTEAVLKRSGRKAPLYRYAFNTVPAIHGIDVPYTFYPSIDTKPAPNKDLAKFWQQAIANFTMFYSPNDESDSEFWPGYEGNKRVMNIGNPGQLLPNYHLSVGEDTINKEKCEFWRSAPYYTPSGRMTEGYAGGSGVHEDQERMEM